MDKAARAAQLLACVAHTGEVFAFAPSDAAAVTWVANPSTEPNPSHSPLNPLDMANHVRLTGARASFASPSRLPVSGDELTDSQGNCYRVAFVPGELTNPLLTLVCNVTAL
jgi:hypothetical protein